MRGTETSAIRESDLILEVFLNRNNSSILAGQSKMHQRFSSELGQFVTTLKCTGNDT